MSGFVLQSILTDDSSAYVLQDIAAETETVVLPDNFDSALGTATVTDALTSTPSITIIPNDQGDTSGELTTYNRFAGVNGKTPSFERSFADYVTGDSTPSNSEWGMVWRYVDDDTVPADGRPRAWNRFDNNSGSVTHTFSNNDPFTQDEIEVAVRPRWRYLDTQRAFDYLEGTGLATELPSSIAAGGLPKHAHAQFTHSGTTENNAPVIAINMYGCLVDDTSVQPDSGKDKLNVIMVAGQHASEDMGNESCWEAVYFYTDGTGTVADWFRKHCRLYVYDGNPQGRYYGAERHTDETGGDEDPNREWISGGGDSVQIDSIMDAIDADITRVDILLDWHGAYWLNGNGESAEYGIYETYATEGTWRARINAIITPLSVADIGNAPAGCAQEYGNDTLGAQLSSTPEFPIAPPGYPDMQDSYEPVAEAYFEAIQEMVDADELTLTTTSATITAETGTLQITGNDLTLLAGYGLTLESGSLSITGQDANLLAGRTLTADTGQLAITGNEASLAASHVVAAETGSMVLTGNDAALRISETLSAETGQFLITGNNAELVASRLLNAETGSLVITGNDAALNTAGAFTLTAESGQLVIAGQDAGLIISHLLSAETGQMTLTGGDVDLQVSRTISLDTGNYEIIGQNADFAISSSVLVAEAGSFVLTGNSVNFNYSAEIKGALECSVSLRPLIDGDVSISPVVDGGSQII